MIMASCVDISNGGGNNTPLATPPPRVPAILGPASTSLCFLNEADGKNRKNERQPPADMGEEEDSRNVHRRNLKRKKPEGGLGDVDGSSRSASGERNVRRRRRERSAVHDDVAVEAAGADNSKEPPAKIPETLGWENKVTPGPKDHAVDAKAIAADMAAKYRDGFMGGGNGREDRAGETRPIQQPPVPRQLHEDYVRKPAAAAPNQPLVVPVVGERTKYRHASLSTTEDDSAEDEVDPNRPCRVIQFVTVTHRRQLMQALQCNATDGSRQQPLHLRWREEEVGLATTAKKRGIGSGSRSTSEGDDDDHSAASDSTDDYSTSSSSSTANSHECDASSVDSDLTTDPRLFAIATSAAAARVSAAEGETDVAYPLAESGGDEDDADNEHRGGRHYGLNLPPEVAWKALIVLSILVILLDLIYSTVADVVIRVVNRPRRTNRQPQPPAPALSAAKGEVDLLANSKELER
jgi:hypothetical protein